MSPKQSAALAMLQAMGWQVVDEFPFAGVIILALGSDFKTITKSGAVKAGRIEP